MLGFLPLTFLISLHKIPSVINTSFGWKYFSWTGRTCTHKEEIIMNLQAFMFKISTASQVSGEIFGHNRSKSYCSRVQPVTCCNLSFYILLIWCIFYRILQSDQYFFQKFGTSTSYFLQSTSLSVTSGWFLTFTAVAVAL